MAMGKRIRERRKALRMTQERLALEVGCAQSTIQSIESRDSRKSDHDEELAKALRTSIEWLRTGRDSSLTVAEQAATYGSTMARIADTQAAQDAAALVDIFLALDTERRRLLIDVAEVFQRTEQKTAPRSSRARQKEGIKGDRKRQATETPGKAQR